MLENMFVGKPLGNYDRLLDFSRPVTGTLFFVPSATFLDDVAAGVTPTGDESAAEAEPPAAAPDGSLGIGSLKKDVGKVA
jgi:porphyrinogen peroxidase